MSENQIVDTLRDKVKLKAMICGVGNAGNQLVECAYKNGFENVFAVNSSSRDMDNDVLNANINCFLIGNNARGAGMNRNAAKELFKMNFRQLFDNMKFKQMCDDIYLTNKEKIDMIIITNDIRINGASVILYEGVIEKIAEEQNADLFLLPSSIHEMILVPVRDPADRAIFSQMVQSM